MSKRELNEEGEDTGVVDDAEEEKKFETKYLDPNLAKEKKK